MKVALYARCSSDKQENLDRSIPAQLGALRDYAAKNEYLIYKEYLEPGESAYSDDENREKFHEMIRDAKVKKFDAVLVHRFNRFYRDQYKSMFYKKILRDNGIKIISITEELDPDTIQGFMLERMIEMMDQVSSMQNAWETIKGMTENAKQGYKNGGRVPYGYKRIQIPVDINRPNPRYKVKWEIDPEKAEIVKTIFNKRCEGLSLRKIIDYLNNNHIPSPTNKLWDTSTIRYFFIKADMYAGDYLWNISDMKIKGKKWKDKKEWVIVENAHPPIIDRETAEKAKVARGTSNNLTYISSDNSRFILTGKNLLNKSLFYCSNCGANYIGYDMRGSTKDKRYLKYICSEYRKRGTLACVKPFYISKDWIEREIINEINNRYSGNKKVEKLIRDLLQGEKNKGSQIDSSLKRINSDIRQVKRQIDKLTEAIFAGVDKTILIPESKELAKKIKGLEKKKQYLLDEKENKKSIGLDHIISIFKNFKSVMSAGTYGQQHLAIKTFLKDIAVDPVNRKITASFFELPSDVLTSHCPGGGTRT